MNYTCMNMSSEQAFPEAETQLQWTFIPVGKGKSKTRWWQVATRNLQRNLTPRRE